MSENISYPDAPPTAPGGMNQKALIAELVSEHGWTKTKATALIWREQIEAVIRGRLDNDDLDEDQDDLPDGLCEHGEDPTMCDACEYGLIGEDGTDPDEDDVQVVLAAHDGEPWGQVEEALSDAGLDDGLDDLMAEFTQAKTEHKQAVEQVEQMLAVLPPLFIGMPGVLDYSFDGHSGSGPSQAERWMHCTASMGAARGFLETLSRNQQTEFAFSSVAARQGTTAHAAAETEVNLLLGNVSDEEAETTLLELAIMPDAAGEAYDSDMAEHISEYVDLVRQYIDFGRTVLVEQRVEALVPLTQPLPDGSDVYSIPGSADCVVLPASDEKVLVVGDLKYGNGIDVDVDENPQVRIYALGVLSDLANPETGELPDIERVDYHIIQPRLGGIKTWSESVDDLLRWRDEVLSPALTKALLGASAGATYEPSEGACQWCPARGTCSALSEARFASAAELFDTIVEAEFIGDVFPETGTLTAVRLGSLLTQAKAIKDIYDGLKDEAQRRLHRGDSVPGFKLVSYTPPRKWGEDAASDEAMANLPVWRPQQLLTPTQALKVLGEKADQILSFIESPDKRPVVAPDGDRRKEWVGTPPEQMFEVE